MEEIPWDDVASVAASTFQPVIQVEYLACSCMVMKQRFGQGQNTLYAAVGL